MGGTSVLGGVCRIGLADDVATGVSDTCLDKTRAAWVAPEMLSGVGSAAAPPESPVGAVSEVGDGSVVSEACAAVSDATAAVSARP